MAVPTGNAGSMANALSQVRAAYDILAKVASAFPMGSEQAKQLQTIMTTMNRMAPPSAATPGVQQVTAAGLNADAQKNAAQSMLAPTGASAGGGGQGTTPSMPPSPAMPPSLAA